MLPMLAAAQDVPVGAVLRAEDRMEVGAATLVVSPDGTQVLLASAGKAILLAADGSVRSTVALGGIAQADVANTGQHVLLHGGGVTVHGPDLGREQLRLAGMGKVVDVAIAPDGKRLAMGGATVSVHDAINGRVAFSVAVAADAVRFDADGSLWVNQGEELLAFDTRGRKMRDPGVPSPPAGVAKDGCVAVGMCFDGPVIVRGSGAWRLSEGVFERWRLLVSSDVTVTPPGEESLTALAWSAGPEMLVVHQSGRLDRTGPDGAPITVLVPECSPCSPTALGGGTDGVFWAMGPAGVLQSWHPAGAPLAKPRWTGAIAAVRLADGRWAALGADGRPRIGGTPGKGRPGRAVPGAVGLHAEGELIAVWSAEEVVLFDARGEERSAPALGSGRKPLQVAVAPGGAAVAVLDDQDFLHLYRADGQPVFRVPMAFGGTVLAWNPDGATIYAGSGPLGAFQAKDGKEAARLWLSGLDVSRVAVGPDGRLALLVMANGATQLAMIRPDAF